MTEPAATPTPARATVRRFSRFELLELLGRSERTMAWRARDPRVDQELVVVMPRSQLIDGEAARHWDHAVRRAARLNHPNLAHVVEVGMHEHWPFVAYDAQGAVTLAAHMGPQGLPARECAQMISHAAQGLAYAHEAGAVHGDIQVWQLLVAESGQIRLMGLDVAFDSAAQPFDDESNTSRTSAASETDLLRAQRRAAQRDVLTLGLVLHLALTGQQPLDEPDTARVVQRMPPAGRDIVRLPWSAPRPIPDPLRAIANRATDRQERQRYRGARTLINALEGWLKVDAAAGGGPLALLADRLHAVGVLPGSPGGPERAAHMALMDRERTNELAEVVLQDLALSFELLRAVNTAQVRGAQVSGAGPVLTVRRAIAMLGLDGVRRAALGLRQWPGPLSDSAARELERLILRVRRAGRVAQRLRPAGYDAEVVNLVAMLQNLGMLVAHYHFADECVQIYRLMQPGTSTGAEVRDEPGMSEQAASYAVLGVDIEDIGVAVARHWGLDDSVISMIRRLSTTAAVHTADTDDEMLRIVGSCANEVLETAELPEPKAAIALGKIAQRYARTLDITLRDLEDSLQMSAGLASDGVLPPEVGDLPTLNVLL
jgi:non-specific serine/threonine protein kinase